MIHFHFSVGFLFVYGYNREYKINIRTGTCLTESKQICTCKKTHRLSNYKGALQKYIMHLKIDANSVFPHQTISSGEIPSSLLKIEASV